MEVAILEVTEQVSRINPSTDIFKDTMILKVHGPASPVLVIQGPTLESDVAEEVFHDCVHDLYEASA